MKKGIIILLIIAVLISGAMLLKKRKQSIKNAPLPTPVTLQVQVVSAGTEYLEQTQPFLAQLVSREIVKISSRLSGRITELLVRESQKVKQGDLLLKIDDLEIVSGVKALQASLEAQKKDVQYSRSLFERNKSLFEAGGLAREKLEASEVLYASKQAALENTRQKITGLEAQLSYLKILAPFDGTVGTLFSRTGDLASPGKALLSINSTDRKLTFSYVPGVSKIKEGQEVFVHGRKIGQITTLYSDAEKGLSVAEVGVESSLPLPNNSYVNIDLLSFSGTGCRIPLNAIIHVKEGMQVMEYADGEFTALPVSLVAANKEFALVEPCPAAPVAVAAEAKLSQLPGFGKVLIHRSSTHE
jgi:multidrug efflux pump subunit AcrA (membrane-fusion protein)